MPISPRSRFVLAASVVLVLLAWPIAVSRSGINALPLVFVPVGAAALVSAIVRAGYHFAGRAPLVPKDLGLDVCLFIAATLAFSVSTERPTNRTGNRPAEALFGPFAEIYDPCERGERALVRSGVAPRIGYVCQEGYTTRICASETGCPGHGAPSANDPEDTP